MNDLIKTLILKFKVDSKEVDAAYKKMADTTRKAFGEKGGGGFAQYSKSLGDFEKNYSKMFGTVDKGLSKTSKLLQDIVKKDLQQMGKQVEQIHQKAERRLQKYQSMIDRGVSGPRLERARRLAEGTGNQFAGAADQFSSASNRFGAAAGGGGQGGGGINGLLANLLGPAALVSAPGQIANYIQNRARAGIQNPATAIQPALAARMRYYGGDLTDAIIAQGGGQKRILDYANKQTRTGVMGEAVGAGASLAALVSGAALTFGTGGVGALGGLPMMIAGGAGLAKYGTGAIDRIFNNKTEAEFAQNYQEARDAEIASRADAQLYQQFRQVAPGRAKFERLFGASSGDIAFDRQEAFANRMTEEEYTGIATGLRGNLGSTRARVLATAAGRASFGQDISQQTAASALSAFAMSGTGGTQNAEKKLEELFTKSVSGGITDSGLREALLKQTTSIVETANNRIDPAEVLRSLMQFMPGLKPGEQLDERALNAASQANQFENDVMSGGGLNQAMRQSQALKLLQSKGIAATATNMQYLTQLSPAEIKAGGTDYTKNVLGLSAEDIKGFGQATTQAIYGVNSDVGAIQKQIADRKAKGLPVPESLNFALSTAIAASQGKAGVLSDEAAKALTLKGTGSSMADSVAAGGVVTPEMQKAMQAGRAASSAAQAQEDANFKGQAAQDRDMNNIINAKRVKDAAVASDAGFKEVGKAGEGDPSKAAEMAAASMGRFSSALDKLTDKLNRASYGSASPGR